MTTVTALNPTAWTTTDRFGVVHKQGPGTSTACGDDTDDHLVGTELADCHRCARARMVAAVLIAANEDTPEELRDMAAGALLAADHLDQIPNQPA